MASDEQPTPAPRAPRCGATARIEGEAVHCDLPPDHRGKHRDYVEDMRWSS